MALGQDRRRPGRAQPLSSRAAGGQCGCVGIRRGAAVPSCGRTAQGSGLPDPREGRAGSRPPSLREEGWGPGPPGPKEEGLRPCAPGSEGERAGGPDSCLRGKAGSCATCPPTAAPRCLGAAGETETRASAPVWARGLFLLPGHKEGAASLQTGTRGSQIPLDAHTPSLSGLTRKSGERVGPLTWGIPGPNQQCRAFY